MDLFVLPSRIADDGDRDGLPNVLLEAASQSLACPICTMTDILDAPDKHECATCGHEWPKAEESSVVTDSNGNVLNDGDSVTLIKDLDVKGAGFVAKRGTMVRKIRLIDDPDNIEGRVNKMTLVLKTKFLKKVS